MADYRSTLTGTQMDAALLDMAEHNSEAYAVGERNGIAVASDDVTYHNNARYYAQIASSQIVGDASSAVRWDTDQSEVLTDAQKAQARENINAASDSDVVKITAQTLTTAQQSQARANIMAGGSNRNLLDNPWFTVNQRGKSSYGAGNSVDRWIVTSNASINVLSDGIELTTTANRWGMEQRCVKNLIPHGTTVTFSALIDDGEIVQGSFVWNGSNVNLYPNGSAVGLEINTAPTAYDRWYVCNAVASTHTIHAVKIEVGSVSTLANDAPPKYKSELDDCNFFCRVLKGNLYNATGMALATTEVRFTLPYEMYKQPTPSFSGTIRVLGPGGFLAVSAVTVSGWSESNVEIACAVSGATTYTPYFLAIGNNSQIVLSAEP